MLTIVNSFNLSSEFLEGGLLHNPSFNIPVLKSFTLYIQMF